MNNPRRCFVCDRPIAETNIVSEDECDGACSPFGLTEDEKATIERIERNRARRRDAQ